MATLAASMYNAMGDENAKSVHVRNTFIEVEEEETHSAAKRTSSLPASFRLTQDEPLCMKKGLQLPFRPPRDGSSAGSTGDGSSQDEGLSDVDVSTEAPSELSSLQPVRTCLRSGARAWNPCEEDAVLREIREGAESMRQAIMATGLVMSSNIVLDKNGFEILAMSTQDQALEGVLTMAKHSLLQWAETSSSIYVLGYCHRPFIPLPDGIGFVATMSVLEDTSCCCWDAYKWGYCKRGQQCRWQHPRRLVPLSLRIRSGMPCWPANCYNSWEEGSYQAMPQGWAPDFVGSLQ
eukprot:TRINITY_DN61706_c0_g1_i1.p1 TRINITY_DN61706_c0_g1~~TRINITY_DN61706_c0_g1_i1.p1  ORF type:complete len:292 (+),score=67.27 TRINITY_DN61706_c0_g1_i1:179-1054(+)